MPEPEKEAYAGTVLERLANPFIDHRLASIALNSVSKFRLRVLPSLLEYQKRKGAVPPLSAFSLAALIAFYKAARPEERRLAGKTSPGGPVVEDEPEVLRKFVRAHASSDPGTVCRDILGDEELWGIDLQSVAGLADQVTRFYGHILTRGAEEAMRSAVAAEERT
jgi:tagaturonate reductase